jgi:hypothetical protein
MSGEKNNKKSKDKRGGPGWDIKGNQLDGYWREYWPDLDHPMSPSPCMASLCGAVFILLLMALMVFCWM